MATVMFWDSVLNEQKPRFFRSRFFKNFWTFALLALVVVVLSSVLSLNSNRDAGTEPTDVVVVDVGSEMASPGPNRRTLLENAAVEAAADAGHRNVTPALIAAGDQPALLGKRGQPLSIFRSNLSGIKASHSGSSSSLALQLAFDLCGDRPGTIDWYTDRTALPEDLPVAIARRVRIHSQALPTEAVAITDVAFNNADSLQAGGTIDVTIAGRSAEPVTVLLQSGDAAVPAQLAKIENGRAIVSFAGIPADGRVVSIALTDAPGSPLQHQTQFVCPAMAPLKFVLVGSIPRPLVVALLAVGSIETSPAGCIAVVAAGNSVPDGATSVIRLVDSVTTDAVSKPLRVVDDGRALLSGLNFEGAVATAASPAETQAGPTQAGQTPVIAAGTDPVVWWGTNSDPRRCLYLMSSLVDDSAQLPRKAAFPSLISRLANQVAGCRPAPPVVTGQRASRDPTWAETNIGDSAVDDVPSTSTGSDKKYLAARDSDSGTPSFSSSDASIAIGLLLFILEGILLSLKKII